MPRPNTGSEVGRSELEMLPDGVALRTARTAGSQNDLAFLFEVYAATRADEMAMLVDWSETVKTTFLRSQFELQHRHYQDRFPDASYDLICENERPIGRYYVQSARDEVRIMDLALLPAWRGRGIGRWLVQRTLNAAALQRRRVSLHVEATNPAKRLYERMGFCMVGDVGVYERMLWEPPAASPVS